MRFEGFREDEMEQDEMSWEETEEVQEDGVQEEDMEVELLKFYLEDLKAIPPVSEEEKVKLMQKAVNKEKESLKKLAEIYLMRVIEMAASYRGKGVGLADLIQEANVGLMEAISEEEITEEKILEGIERALKQAVEEEDKENTSSEQIAEKLNLLSDATKELADRHGQEPSVEELAEYLQMTEEEVKDYMKLSVNALGI